MSVWNEFDKNDRMKLGMFHYSSSSLVISFRFLRLMIPDFYCLVGSLSNWSPTSFEICSSAAFSSTIVSGMDMLEVGYRRLALAVSTSPDSPVVSLVHHCNMPSSTCVLALAVFLFRSICMFFSMSSIRLFFLRFCSYSTVVMS